MLLAVAMCAAMLVPALAAAAAADTIAVQSVDTSQWPKITMRVVLPSGMLEGGTLAASDFALTENGSKIGGVKAAAVSAQRRSLDVFLVIDTSRSMKGAQLAQAKAAAQRFVSGMGARDRVGLITFGRKPSVVASLTTDREALASAIAGLEAGDWTALYDAVAVASDGLGRASATDRAIVVLSDGEDSESGHTLESAATLVQQAGTPVYAVALGDATGTKALQAITRASGGRLLTAKDAADLVGIFSGIARQLTSPYDVTFTSLRPPAKDLELVLTAASGTGRASVTVAVPNPDTLAVGQVNGTPVGTPSGVWPAVIALLVFLAVGSIALAILLLSRPEPNAIAQLRYFEQLRSAGVGSGHSRDVDPESVQGRVVGLAGVVAAKGGFDTAIRQALERAGLPLRPVEYMIMHSAGVLVLGALAQIVSGNFVVSGLAVIVLALGPVMVLQYLARRRTGAFQEQLPDVLNLLASSLRAGWGLQQAVGVVVTELGPPAAPEFERVVTEARLGLPLEDALEKMAVRMDSEDFKWAVTAIAIQREVGGNLAEVLDMVASTIRERGSLRRQISSLTAEGRLSAIILIALPFFEAGALLMLNPGYFAPLVSSPYGLVTAGIGLALLGVGIVWLRNVVRIEV